MGRVWSVFFGGTAVAALVVSIMAPRMGLWFPVLPQAPGGEPLSTIGVRIDGLFYLILWLCTVVFIGTQSVLAYVLWTGSAGKDRRAWYTHGNHTLELVWSVIPGLILLFLAFYQIDVWAKFRIKSTVPKPVLNRPVAEITARQFEWRIRYPAPGKVLQPKPQPDDIYAVNELHVPEGRMVTVRLVSEDVLHSFFVPHLRIKQDAVPGLAVPVWFEATTAGTYEIVCAELCGWGHYKMAGRLMVQPLEDYTAYLKQLSEKQFSDGTAPAVAKQDADAGPAAGSHAPETVATSVKLVHGP